MWFPTRTRSAALRTVREIHSSRLEQLPGGALLLLAATLVLIIVPFARAATGETSSSGSGAATPAATQASATLEISAKLAKNHDLGAGGLRAKGTVRGARGANVRVRLWVRSTGAKDWKIATSKRVGSGKRFELRWNGNRPGRYMTRVSVHLSGKSAIDNTGRAYVFRKGHASYYGPGLYGGGLACGGSLARSTVGVAHKTLPCGTRVSFTLGDGKVVTAPVIDRGPFIAGRDWDLTAALKHKLGFGDIGAIYATR